MDVTKGGRLEFICMELVYTIGQLAKEAGVPTTTVRYYERRGLLRPPSRVGSGKYRSYGEDDLEQLRFIRAAQAAGFVLEDVATLLGLRDGNTTPCKEVQTLIETRLGDVAQRVADLQRVEGVLKKSLRMCRQKERTGHCDVIDTLSVVSGRRKRRSSH